MYLQSCVVTARRPSLVPRGQCAGVRCPMHSGRLTHWRGRSTHELNYAERPEDGTLASPSSSNSPLAPLHSTTKASDKTLVMEDLSTRITRSFSIMQGCPWVAPRPLYILAVASRFLGPEQASMYLLPTRIVLEDATSELASVLGSNVMEMSAMRDGVVAFEKLQDAEKFSLQLQEELQCEAYVATFDSHELFRLVGEVNGVVVHLAGEEQFVPTPQQLAAYVCL